MKPTANGQNYSNFLVKESRANLLSYILEIFELKEWPYLDDFQEILVQVNKAVYEVTHHTNWLTNALL